MIIIGILTFEYIESNICFVEFIIQLCYQQQKGVKFTLGKKLQDILRNKKISIQELSDRSGVPIETIRNIYYGRTADPKASTVFEISKALDVTVNYLMGSPMYKDDEFEIIQNYRRCGVHGKGMIQIISKYEALAAHKETGSLRKHSIPCLIPIGKVTDGIIYNSCNVIDVETTMKHASLAIEITTNYFAPAYCKGDRVLFENRFPDVGERAVFSDGEKCYFRLFLEKDGQYILKCLNGNGKDFYLNRMDEMVCLCTCIGVMRS